MKRIKTFVILKERQRRIYSATDSLVDRCFTTFSMTNEKKSSTSPNQENQGSEKLSVIHQSSKISGKKISGKTKG